MRKNIVAGNWKMNTTLQEGVALAKEIDAALAGVSTKCDVIIATPFTHLVSVVNAVDTKRIGVGAENCADKTEGAYTGEVSAKMVASTGAQYVILGHSERRAYYHETPEILKEKVLLALANGLTPIFCIGEVLEEREAGKHFDVVKAQVEESLFNLSAEKSFWLMSRFGRSVQERLQLPTKLKKYMLLSVRPLPTSMEKKWQRILRSFMVEAVSRAMQPSCSLNPM